MSDDFFTTFQNVTEALYPIPGQENYEYFNTAYQTSYNYTENRFYERSPIRYDPYQRPHGYQNRNFAPQQYHNWNDCTYSTPAFSIPEPTSTGSDTSSLDEWLQELQADSTPMKTDRPEISPPSVTEQTPKLHISFTKSSDGIYAPVLKKKRVRTAFTLQQLEVLEERFLKAPYLPKAQRQVLAQSLGLADRVVTVWFQNRRLKDKKLKEEQNCQSSLINSTIFEPVSPPAAGAEILENESSFEQFDPTIALMNLFPKESK